jgi:hypothetical protein
MDHFRFNDKACSLLNLKSDCRKICKLLNFMIGTVLERECACNSNNHCCVHVYNYLLLLSFRHKQRKEN